MRPISRLTAASAWRRMFYDRSKLDLKAIREGYLAPYRIKGTGNTLWEMWRDVRRDKPIDFRRIKAPVLILWAERERIIPFESRALSRLRKHFPSAQVISIPRTGHLLLEENPEASNAAIRSFLEGVPQPQTEVAVERVEQPA
jgi:pimeloyl-ACP methyl ester carboxylesterase